MRAGSLAQAGAQRGVGGQARQQGAEVRNGRRDQAIHPVLHNLPVDAHVGHHGRHAGTHILERLVAALAGGVSAGGQGHDADVEARDLRRLGIGRPGHEGRGHAVQLQALQAKLEACQEQNNLNGRLLELSIISNRRLASFLSKLRDSNSLTYDAKGNTRSGTRSLGIKA